MKIPTQPRYNLKRHAIVYSDDKKLVVFDPTDEQLSSWKADNTFFVFCPGGELLNVAIDWTKGAIRGSYEKHYSEDYGCKNKMEVSWFGFDTDLLEEII